VLRSLENLPTAEQAITPSKTTCASLDAHPGPREPFGVSGSAPTLPSWAALLQEQRYRRHFLDADARQNTGVILIAGAAYSAVVYNDFLLLGGWMLHLAVAVRVVTLAMTVVCYVLLRRAKWPRQHDSATTAWFLTMGAICCPITLTRLSSGEYLGPLSAGGATLCAMMFAMRGPIWPRAFASGSAALSAVVLLWNPRAPVTPVGRITSTLALVALTAIGVLAARAFEEQRRKRFDAERHERQARRELAAKAVALEAEKTRAEALSRVKSDFLATMSHELRTPMNAVIGLSELLVASPLSPEQRLHAKTLHESARGLVMILNDILDTAKMESGRIELVRAAFRVRAVAEGVIDLFGARAKQRGLALGLVVDDDVPEGMTGDVGRVRQILSNLLSNAIKFTSHGTVTVRVSSRPGKDDEAELRFAVEDTGPGIPAETLERLFVPFEQGTLASGQPVEGTGLGLAISRRLAEAMGGTLTVDSTVGKGSVFTLTVRLPVTAPPAPRESSDAGAETSAPLRVLVADDNEVNRLVAKAMLAKLGCRPDLAVDGRSTLEAVERTTYDLVFLDLRMPDMSGIDVARTIHDTTPEDRRPRLVGLTASAFAEDHAACLAAGMSEVLTKPMVLADLRSALLRASSVDMG
jgi:signal transduction histidine kinase/ActR/RegA family two-component response regulator